MKTSRHLCPNERTSKFKVPVSSYSEPQFEGLTGNGSFTEARLSLTMTDEIPENQIHFALKVDHNILFSGMPDWYLNNTGKIRASGVQAFQILTGGNQGSTTQVSITMKLPFPIRFYSHVQIAVSTEGKDDNIIKAARLYVTAVPPYESLESDHSILRAIPVRLVTAG